MCQIDLTTGNKEFKKLSKLSKVKYERQMLICKIWLALLCEWGLVASWCEFCVHGLGARFKATHSFCGFTTSSQVICVRVHIELYIVSEAD